MSNAKTILTTIKKKEKISSKLIHLLYIKKDLTLEDATFLYAVAQLLINEYRDNQVDNRFLLINYAYTIIAITSFKIKDYRALYDFSINYGFYPIARKIIDLNLIEDIGINHVLSNVGIDFYTTDNKTLTYEQKSIFSALMEDKSSKIGFLAPTSYGKTEIIFQHLEDYQSLKYVGIIVPTKALIYQVFLEAKEQVKDRKIIVHDQNFEKNKDDRILAIVTQERALRLLDSGLVFDMLYIDEAHEMLDFDFRRKMNNRSLLLIRFIKLARKNNPNLKEMYLSPVIDDSNSLTILNSKSIESYKIVKDLKILDINYLDTNQNHLVYDRFLGDFINTGSKYEISEYINKFSKSKNLHFLFKPKYIEQFADELSQYVSTEIVDNDIQELIDELNNLVHPKYNLIKLIEKGIIYLHGSVPQMVRNYLIDYVKKSPHIKHFVANSVILGGVNLPIDTLFYYAGAKKAKDLFNLIGRVNRLNEIFGKKNKELSKIFIPINFIDHPQFNHLHKTKTKNIIEVLRGKLDDDVKNPLLENANINQNNMALAEDIRKKETKLRDNFDNLDFEDKLLKGGAQQLFNYTERGKLKLELRIKNFDKKINKDNLLEVMQQIFINGFETQLDFLPLENAGRLKYDETINFYKIFIKQLNQMNLKERIESMVKYWKTKKDDHYKIYVGKSFGDVKYNIDSHEPLYINLDEYIHDDDKLHNYAIIKQQLDEDFIDFEIMKLLSTMLEFNLISQNLLDEFLYGTRDEKDLKILRSGLGRSLYKKLINDNMSEHIKFDRYGNLKATKELRKYIEQQKGIVKFELELHFK